MKLKNILTVFCLLLIATTAFSEKTNKPVKIDELISGSGKSSTIELNNGFGMPSRQFSFRVPKNAYAIRITVSDAKADLDLFLHKGSKIDDYSVVDYSSEEDTYNETFFLSRQSDIPLETGIYYLSVVYQYDYLPVINGVNAEKIDFSIDYEVIVAEPETSLQPGISYKMTLKPENGMFGVASVDIPRGTEAFRVDVFDTEADIDIFASLKTPAKSRDEALYASESMLGNESLVIKGYSDSKLVSGRYYLSFLDQLAKDLPQDLSLVVTLDTEAPEILKEFPVIPEAYDSFDSALLSTVEIISENGKGSGCLLSRSGHIVTNWHVIKGADGNPSQNNFIAISLSHYTPPSEMFSAEVLEYDEDLDLALLKINGGLYGQPLPYGYEFPYFNIGNPAKLRIGQPLGVIGYPEVGGTGSRTSVTFTSGIVSGFEAGVGCRLIKTDAPIGSGNSGGAVIDAYYELLGFPGYVMDINNDTMGYVYPVSCLPSNWLRMISAANR